MRTVCAVVSLIVMLTLSLAAQERIPASPLAKEFAGQVTSLAKKWTTLFDAMPEGRLDWRPSAGVRSVREIYTHIGDANDMFLMIVGIKLPDSPAMPKDQAERENRLKTKAAIAHHLKRSFELAETEMAKLTDADLNREINMFGTKTTVRNAMLVNVGHMHEHLGQSIAYARVNGIKPPWSGE